MLVRPASKALVGAAVAACVSLTAAPAKSDPSGWLHMGGGFDTWQMGAMDGLEFSPTMTIDLGVGSDTDAPFIFGGLFRLHPVFGWGTDVSWMVRAATGGFQSDWFGFAVDVGPYVRGWGDGSAGFVGQGILGGPLGLQLAALGSYGSNDAAAFGLTLGLDLARLTAYRQHLLNWWPSPRPVKSLDDRADAHR